MTVTAVVAVLGDILPSVIGGLQLDQRQPLLFLQRVLAVLRMIQVRGAIGGILMPGWQVLHGSVQLSVAVIAGERRLEYQQQTQHQAIQFQRAEF